MMKRNRLFLLLLPWAVCAMAMIMPPAVHASNLEIFANTTYYVSGGLTTSPLNIGTLGSDAYTTATIDTGSPSGGLLSIGGGPSAPVSGTLNIDSGGTLTNNSVGTGAAPTPFGLINAVTSSAVNINSGGTLDNAGNASIGGGTLIINSGGTLTNSGQLFSDGSGGGPYATTVTNAGTLTNSGFGQLWNGSLSGAYGSPSNQTADVLTNTGTLNNFNLLENYGTLNNNLGGVLTSNGTLENNDILNNNLGATLTNSGTLTVTKTGTLNNYSSGTVANPVGLTNNGTLNNNSGGTLTNSGTLTNNGTVFNNGTITNSGTFSNLYSYTSINGSGTYTQTGGLTKVNGTMTQGTVDIKGGTLNGTGTITASVINEAPGTIQAGDAPGTLTIIGNLTSSGTLLFEIEGTTSGKYGVLNVEGTATFTGGKIEFDFINGYSPSPGNSWDLLFYRSIVGGDTLGFTEIGLGPGLGYQFNPANGTLSVSSVPLPPSLLLFGPGLAGLAAIRRRLKK
jgi:hypothetical protein